MKGLARRMLAAMAGRLRTESPRHLFWSIYYPFNFGDWIGPYLYQRFTGEEPWFALPNDISRDSVYMTAGSILSKSKSNSIIWGSGILRADESFQQPWHTLAVRGPLTRQAFVRQGYPCPETYGDPAILLPIACSPRLPKQYSMGLVPHFRDFERVTAAFGGREDIRIIDVRQPVEQVVDQICSCDRIASSSLHGIIVAHAFGIRAIWVHWNHESGDGVKYRDYFHSADIVPYDPPKLLLNTAQLMGSLIDQIDATRLPDLSSLQAGLLDVCPFAPRTDLGVNRLDENTPTEAQDSSGDFSRLSA